MSFYVYQLRLATSEAPFYIGKGKGSRAVVHFSPSSLRHRNRKNAILKSASSQGIDVLTERLACDLTEGEAFAEERRLIAHYGRLDEGTGCLANHTDGGQGATGRIHSVETRAAIGRAQKGRQKTPEEIAKSAAIRRGRRFSPEARARIALARIGLRHSVETRAKLSALKLASNPVRRLSQESVSEIRSMALAGVPYSEICAKFGIGKAHVSRIKTGRARNYV